MYAWETIYLQFNNKRRLLDKLKVPVRLKVIASTVLLKKVDKLGQRIDHQVPQLIGHFDGNAGKELHGKVKELVLFQRHQVSPEVLELEDDLGTLGDPLALEQLPLLRTLLLDKVLKVLWVHGQAGLVERAPWDEARAEEVVVPEVLECLVDSIDQVQVDEDPVVGAAVVVVPGHWRANCPLVKRRQVIRRGG